MLGTVAHFKHLCVCACVRAVYVYMIMVEEQGLCRVLLGDPAHTYIGMNVVACYVYARRPMSLSHHLNANAQETNTSVLYIRIRSYI